MGGSAPAPRGFAGLALLASTMPPMPTFDVPPPPLNESKSTADQAPIPVSHRSKFWTTNRVWAVIVVSFIGGAVLLSSFDEKPGHAPTVRQQPYVPPPVAQIQSSPPPAFAQLPADAEIKPGVGTSLPLSRGEILYCLSERIRLTTMLQIVDHQNQSQLNKVNMRIDDFNLRCASYRYRQLDLDAVQSLVDSRTTSLQADARAIVRSWR
jgi:hypothetical protein